MKIKYFLLLITLPLLFGSKAYSEFQGTVKIDKLEYSTSRYVVDAFARLRVATPIVSFLDQHQYNTSPILWESSITGSSTVTHLPNESTTSLNNTTASGDQVIWQTRKYFRYQPGKSHLIVMTNVLGTGKTNLRKRFGYFDANNGVFFEQSGTTLNVVVRTKTSGLVVDTAVAQSSWNLDIADGTGESRYNLNVANAQIWFIDLQWLGTGRVRFGLFSDRGQPIYLHEVRNANVLTSVYMTTANLPVRYEVTNTGTVASSTSLKQICTAVISEGGAEERDLGYTATASNGITSIAVTTRRPVLSIRPSLTFNSIENRGEMILRSYQVVAATNNSFCEVVYNGTLTGSSFGSVGSSSIADFDVAASSISGGDIIDSFFVVAGQGNSSQLIAKDILDLRPLGIGLAANAPINISIVCTSFTGTSNINAELTWKELY